MKLSHLDKTGTARMVDVSEKPLTHREAVARGFVKMRPGTIVMVKEKSSVKGDVIAVARVAGIIAAKKTGGLIPMCHPLNLTSVAVDISTDEANNRLCIEATVKTVGRTGVEMEALTAVSVAALTIYDMCKSVDKEMIISDIMLMKKSGGKSGVFRRKK